MYSGVFNMSYVCMMTDYLTYVVANPLDPHISYVGDERCKDSDLMMLNFILYMCIGQVHSHQSGEVSKISIRELHLAIACM